VIEWFTLNAAKAMGIARQTGSLAPARWPTWCCGTAIPLSVYTAPEKVLDRRRAAATTRSIRRGGR
jgi:imidazolonepropionase-like amidohydrolase